MTAAEEAAVESFLPEFHEAIDRLPEGEIRDAMEAAAESLRRGLMDEHVYAAIDYADRLVAVLRPERH